MSPSGYPSIEQGDGTVVRDDDGKLQYVTSIFNYCADSVPRSLLRTGQVGIKRLPDGNDSGMFGVAWAPSQKQVRNARGRGKSLHANGFELCDHALPVHPDYYDTEDVVRNYYPAVEALVKAKTGASLVAAFDHNVRSMDGFSKELKLKGSSQAAVQQPVACVHGDYTMTSGPERVRLLMEAPKTNDTYRTVRGSTPLLPANCLDGGRRYMIVNVWRNIREEPIERFPLAVADTSTVRPGDLVTFEIHYADRIGENYFCAEGSSHEWFFFPNMTRDEALIFKQWDSKGSLSGNSDTEDASFCLHSAFADPTTTPSSPDRASIEVRVVAIF